MEDIQDRRDAPRINLEFSVIIGRRLDDALRVETLNAYSSVGNFSEVNMRLQQFYARKKSEPDPT